MQGDKESNIEKESKEKEEKEKKILSVLIDAEFHFFSKKSESESEFFRKA